VYAPLRLTDQWGVLNAPDGALLDAQFKNAMVPAPRQRGLLKGDGWTLELKEGWKMVPAGHQGSFKLVQQKGSSSSP
jgi:hypothetical protein